MVLLATAHSNGLAQLVHNPTLCHLVGGVDSAVVGDLRMRETRSATKFDQFRKGEPTFKTIIEIGEDGEWRVYEDVALAVDQVLQRRGVDGIRLRAPMGSDAPCNESSADTGSISGSSSIEVQRPGVSKIPAPLIAKLYSGSAYLCCFDGGVSWSELQAGGGSCLFRLRADGRKNEHLYSFDQTVFLPCATIEQAEYAELLSGVVTFAERFHNLVPVPGLFILDGDS